MTTIPDHVSREAVRLLNEQRDGEFYIWPADEDTPPVITVAKLLMNPPAPMTDPDEEAAKRVLESTFTRAYGSIMPEEFGRATEQMRKEREAWEAGR